MAAQKIELNITLQWWQALIVLPLLLIAGFIYYQSNRVKLKEDAEDVIRLQLQGVYASQILGQAADEDGGEGLLAAADRAIEAADAVTGIEFKALTARGGGDEAVVRVEIEVNGGPPPDGKSVRYFLFERRLIGGWRYRREVGPLTYYLRLL